MPHKVNKSGAISLFPHSWSGDNSAQRGHMLRLPTANFFCENKSRPAPCLLVLPTDFLAVAPEF